MAGVIAPSIHRLAAYRHAFYLIYFHGLAKTQNNMGRKNSLPRNLRPRSFRSHSVLRCFMKIFCNLSSKDDQCLETDWSLSLMHFFLWFCFENASSEKSSADALEMFAFIRNLNINA
jgi:hypothetical protein